MTQSFPAYRDLTACDAADVLPRSQVLDRAISALYPGMSRILGPAYTVHCPPGDNLMMHAAIYEAPAGSVIVARSDVEMRQFAQIVFAIFAIKMAVRNFTTSKPIRTNGRI